MENLLTCKKLAVGYFGTPLLPPLDLEVRRGDLWAVIGRNGSGKTTWLRTALGLEPPVSGEVIRASGVRLAYVPQRARVDELYPLRVRDVVGLGLIRGWGFLGARATASAAVVTRALEEVGAADLHDQPFRNLSEGQKQRVLFARLAASGADLALLDEPTSAMDSVAEREAFVVLDELRKRHHMAVIVVSHYLGVAREFADHVLLLDREARAVVAGKPLDVFSHPVFVERYGEEAEGCTHD